MTNKSSKSPSGEDREQPNKFIRTEGVEKEDITKNSEKVKSNPNARKEQENLSNRGLPEDQPVNRVRSTGSTEKDQETLPTGEPDPKESKRP